MAVRTPISPILATLTTVASATSYTVPTGCTFTISAATFSNTTATPQSVQVDITPSGGSALTFVGGTTDVTMPAAGSAPVTVPGLVGQSMPSGCKIEIGCSANTSVNAWISGYLQQ